MITYQIPFGMRLNLSGDLDAPINFDASLLTLDLPYGLYPNESSCKIIVPNVYADKVKACANLWELQALYRCETRQYLSTDNNLVDREWLHNVGAIRHSVTLWRIPLPLNWVDQIWVSLDVDNRIKDAYVAKERNAYSLINPLPAKAGAVKQLYFDYCNQELKIK